MAKDNPSGLDVLEETQKNQEIKNIFLSTKKIPPSERLIVALDVENNHKAMQLVDELGDAVVFYKLGLEIFLAGEYFQLIKKLKEKGKKIFADLKFFDVPQTVKLAIKQLAKHGIDFTTVHGNDTMLEAAVSESDDLKVLAVTALTSLDQNDMKTLGFKTSIKNLVLTRAKRALELGCAGVISSGLETAALCDYLRKEKKREKEGNFLVITPGVRPAKNTDDQKRTVKVEQAFYNGADYIVVGRPIREHHGFLSPKQAALNIQKTIKNIFAK